MLVGQNLVHHHTMAIQTCTQENIFFGKENLCCDKTMKTGNSLTLFYFFYFFECKKEGKTL